MELQQFFSTHPAFTHEEFVDFLDREAPRSVKAQESLLAYHRKRGRLLRVRRGLYWVVPPGSYPATCAVDAYLLAAKMAPDAVMAHHTALELHGKAYSVFEELQYLTAGTVRPAIFRGYRFCPVQFPKALIAQGQRCFGVETMDRAGVNVRVTNLERALVDVLDRPDLSGGAEETWRSLEMVEYFDLDRVVDYALLLRNATTIAKIGFFLDQHREALMVNDAHLERLRVHRPRQPHYLDRDHRWGGRFVADWNLVVPPEMLTRDWQSVP
jgi:predicted transcriptional regulator of viral defense system